jgi:hypothetical protein
METIKITRTIKRKRKENMKVIIKRRKSGEILVQWHWWYEEEEERRKRWWPREEKCFYAVFISKPLLLRKASLHRQSPSPWWLQSDSVMGKKSTTLVSFTLRSLQSQLKNSRYSLESTACHYVLHNREPSAYVPRIFHHTSVILISKSYSERKLLRHNYSTKWEVGILENEIADD